MKRITSTVFGTVTVALIFAVVPLFSQAPQPLTLKLKSTVRVLPLLRGVPQTVGMRSGFVRLKPGESVGWHTTGKHEESLVVLQGQGKALVAGKPSLSFTAPAFVYIPPATRHNVANTGDQPLVYVYVVAPAKVP
ncbi:MAG: cupin domain-containing protein [Acidobacteria bacterium]|nr:cupin domain-containing protein [Acidobacteriota bacterium]